MSVSALEVIHVAKALNDGVIAIGELIELGTRNDITEAEAEEIIRRDIEAMKAMRDND